MAGRSNSSDTEIALIKQDLRAVRQNQEEFKLTQKEQGKVISDIANRVSNLATEDFVREQIRLEAEKSAKLYATKVENKPVQAFFKFALGVLGVVVAAAMVAFLNFVLKGGLT